MDSVVSLLLAGALEFSPLLLERGKPPSAAFRVLRYFNIQLSMTGNKFLLFFKCLHFHTEQSIKVGSSDRMALTPLTGNGCLKHPVEEGYSAEKDGD